MGHRTHSSVDETDEHSILRVRSEVVGRLEEACAQHEAHGKAGRFMPEGVGVVKIGAGRFSKILPPFAGVRLPEPISGCDQLQLMPEHHTLTTVARENNVNDWS